MLDFVTVGGPDLPPLQFGKGGQEIVVGTEIWQMAGAQVTGEILHEAEAALAGKGEEVVAAGQLGEDGDTVGLEEVPSQMTMKAHDIINNASKGSAARRSRNQTKRAH